MGKTVKVTKSELPDQLSLIDRFNNWVKNLSIQAWLFFIIIGLFLIAVQTLFLWLVGGLDEVNLLPVIIFNGTFTPFLLALIYYLDKQAEAALYSMRSMLTTTNSEFRQLEYKLTNMPFPLPLVVGLVVTIIVTLMEQLWIVPIRYASLEELQVFAIIFQIVDKSSAFLFGIFVYHTVRQLRLVREIYTEYIRVDIFNLKPLQGFSRLTASTSVGLVIGVYGWIVINPELLSDPIIFGFSGIITIFAVFVFIWPLYGVHKRIKAAKDEVLHEIDLRLDTVISKFNHRYKEDDYSGIEPLNGIISSLEIQHRRISKIPTWPWKPETAQFALTAIALPLVLAILQFLVERAFDS